MTTIVRPSKDMNFTSTPQPLRMAGASLRSEKAALLLDHRRHEIHLNRGQGDVGGIGDVEFNDFSPNHFHYQLLPTSSTPVK